MKIKIDTVYTDGKNKVTVKGFNANKDVKFIDEEGRPVSMKRVEFLKAYKPFSAGNPYKKEQSGKVVPLCKKEVIGRESPEEATKNFMANLITSSGAEHLKGL